jgi:pyrroloquinoline quinone biosynthesis protein B
VVETKSGRRPTVLLAAFAVALALAAFSSCGDRAEPGARYEVFVLGRMQDGGLPHFGCERPCCAAARDAGVREGPACLGIHDRQTGALLLVEATPAIEQQVAHLHELTGSVGRGRRPIDGVLLTHAHIGHYLGLALCGREVASTEGLTVHATPRMAGFLRGHGPWKQLVELGQIVPDELAPGTERELRPGLFVTAIEVPHRDEFSDTVAFKIRGATRTILFCPDVDRWDAEPGLLERLLEGVDVAWIDGTFYGRPDELPGRDLREIPHPPMTDTMQRLAERAQRARGSIRFIHINHTNPVLREDRTRDEVERRGFRIAELGERVFL